jgi:hypothetical protein
MARDHQAHIRQRCLRLRASVHNTAQKKSKSAFAGRVGIGWGSLSSVSGARFQDTQVADESASQSLAQLTQVQPRHMIGW